MPVLARRGPVDFSLDEVAARAGVTRNLLYHYFPAGRGDLVTAAVREAERQLLGPHAMDEEIRVDDPPSAAGLQDALARILDHALAPTHAWRIHRMARGAVSPEAGAIVEGSSARVIRALAALHPPADATSEVALRGYVAYAEAVLDSARAATLPRAEVRRLLGHIWQAVVTAT